MSNDLVYTVKCNADMTEGRGPMVIVAVFSDEDEAWKYCDTKSGVMGRRPATRWKNEKYGDWRVEPMILYTSAEDLINKNSERDKENALNKLTPYERHLLGLK